MIDLLANPLLTKIGVISALFFIISLLSLPISAAKPLGKIAIQHCA